MFSMIDRMDVLKNSKYYLSIAFLVAQQSEDPMTKIGAIIVGEDKEIRSTGYNGLPRGCNHDEDRLERPQKYLWIEHAERNAIYNAARMGISIKDCIMFTNAIPCPDCTRAIIQSGIKVVAVHSKYVNATLEKWKDTIKISTDMLNEAGIALFRYDGELNCNLVGYADGKMINLN
jgi:dCMP deaminase